MTAILSAVTMTASSQVGITNSTLAPEQKLSLVQEWDKTFPKSDKVDHTKVTFVNRFGITLAADM